MHDDADTDSPRTAARPLRDVTRWRVDQLLQAGYDGEAALVLALDRDVDLRGGVAPRARLPRGHRARILF